MCVCECDAIFKFPFRLSTSFGEKSLISEEEEKCYTTKKFKHQIASSLCVANSPIPLFIFDLISFYFQFFFYSHTKSCILQIILFLFPSHISINNC